MSKDGNGHSNGVVFDPLKIFEHYPRAVIGLYESAPIVLTIVLA